MVKFFKIQYIFLLAIILLAFCLRLIKIDSPVADWHAWRQADTASVARSFYQEGFNPFLPRYDDMSAVSEQPKFNPNRYRLVEFPIYNSLVYFAYLINGGIDEKLARLVSALFSIGSLVLVYLISRKYFGEAIGLLSALLYGILPFNVYFSRVILPEPALVFFSLGMFYFASRWIQENKKLLFFLAVFFTSLAFLTKPMAIFYLLPLLLIFYQKEKKWWPIPSRYYFFLILGLTPFILWRIWISQFPEGIPASNWLFNGTDIRFKPSFFKWIINDRFGREILGICGTFLFFIGLLVKPKVSQSYLPYLLGLSMLMYLIIFATGNVQHDYYQYLIVPVLVIFVAKGFYDLLSGIEGFLPRFWTIPIAVLFLPLTIYFTFNEVKSLYQINNGLIVEAGKNADKILPKNAKVIANYNGDSSFLYYVNRPGFTNVPLPTEELVKNFGITHYISTSNDRKTAWIKKYYTTVIDDQYVVVDLTKQTKEFDSMDPEPQ